MTILRPGCILFARSTTALFSLGVVSDTAVLLLFSRDAL
jgi:hypothetical protein